jgi:hypothetical protein
MKDHVEYIAVFRDDETSAMAMLLSVDTLAVTWSSSGAMLIEFGMMRGGVLIQM